MSMVKKSRRPYRAYDKAELVDIRDRMASSRDLPRSKTDLSAELHASLKDKCSVQRLCRLDADDLQNIVLWVEQKKIAFESGVPPFMIPFMNSVRPHNNIKDGYVKSSLYQFLVLIINRASPDEILIAGAEHLVSARTPLLCDELMGVAFMPLEDMPLYLGDKVKYIREFVDYRLENGV